jgi:hypothetical protein
MRRNVDVPAWFPLRHSGRKSAQMGFKIWNATGNCSLDTYAHPLHLIEPPPYHAHALNWGFGIRDPTPLLDQVYRRRCNSCDTCDVMGYGLYNIEAG